MSEIVAIAVLSVYFLAGQPQIKMLAYRLIPHSRRSRGYFLAERGEEAPGR